MLSFLIVLLSSCRLGNWLKLPSWVDWSLAVVLLQGDIENLLVLWIGNLLKLPILSLLSCFWGFSFLGSILVTCWSGRAWSLVLFRIPVPLGNLLKLPSVVAFLLLFRCFLWISKPKETRRSCWIFSWSAAVNFRSTALPWFSSQATPVAPSGQTASHSSDNH